MDKNKTIIFAGIGLVSIVVAVVMGYVVTHLSDTLMELED